MQRNPKFTCGSGWETSAALRDYLFDYIICELVSELGAIVLTGPPSDSGTQAIDKAIRKAFLDLDSDIMNQGAKAISGPTFLNDAMSQLMPAYAGSCALVSCYYSDAQLLKVACTGDSRAVLGRRNEAGQWEAIALSSDQTGSNQNEVARLGKEHPNEPECA